MYFAIVTLFFQSRKACATARPCTPGRKNESYRNSVCFESDRGNLPTNWEAEEAHTTNSNHMRQTRTVHSGNRTRLFSTDKQVQSPLRFFSAMVIILKQLSRASK